MSETLSTLGLKMLANRVAEEINLLGGNISSGSCCPTWEKYQWHVGRFKTLHDVLKWCEEAEQDLYKGNK